MSPRKHTAHLGQLAAAVATYVALTIALTIIAVRADGPDAHAWVPLLGGALTVWLFAAVWVLLALGLSAVATVRALRAPRTARPAPGAGARMPAPPLADVIGWETVRRERVVADEWVAGGPSAPRHAGPSQSATDDVPEEWAQLLAAVAADEADGRVAA